MEYDKWLKTKEAASIIGIAPGTLSGIAASGKGPYYRKKDEGKGRLFKESSVIQFAEKWKIAHPPPKADNIKKRFCRECGADITGSRFFYCSDSCRTEGRNRSNRRHNESLRTDEVGITTNATCPRCGTRHKISGWTGNTNPKIFCPGCKVYVNRIDYTYETRAIGCQI